MNLTNKEPMARKIYKVLVPTRHKRIKQHFQVCRRALPDGVVAQ